MNDLSVLAFSHAGRQGPLEDRFVVGPGYAAVIDGAGSPEPLEIDGLTGGQWIAAFLVRKLVCLEDNRTPLPHAIAEWIDECREELDRWGVDPRDHVRVPAASLVICRFSPSSPKMELAQIGDCVAAAFVDGHAESLFRMQQEPWDRELQAAVSGDLQQGRDPTGTRTRLRRKHREFMNSPNGYGTFTADRHALQFLELREVDWGPVVMASDGQGVFLRDRRGRPFLTSWREKSSWTV